MFFILQISKGLLVAVVLAVSSIYLNDFFAWGIGFDKSPISSIIIAIVLGMCINNFFTLPSSLSVGFDFALQRVLKLGIILLGIRLSMLDVFALASAVLPLIVICIVVTLAATYWIARRFSIDTKFAFLTAVGTSICGVTAIVATSPVIQANKEQTSYAIANITIFGVLAMLLYPSLAHFSFDTALQIGYFLGTSVHETSQVAGAGLIYAQQFGAQKVLDAATITKLLRNSFMLLVIPLVAFFYHKNARATQTKVSMLKLFPYFILGFLAMALIRTLGDDAIETSSQFLLFDVQGWKQFIAFIKSSAELCLTIAMACVGLTTNVKSICALGLKPFYIGSVISLITGVTSFVFISVFYL